MWSGCESSGEEGSVTPPPCSCRVTCVTAVTLLAATVMAPSLSSSSLSVSTLSSPHACPLIYWSEFVGC